MESVRLDVRRINGRLYVDAQDLLLLVNFIKDQSVKQNISSDRLDVFKELLSNMLAKAK
jgi:hypothetical protein